MLTINRGTSYSLHFSLILRCLTWKNAVLPGKRLGSFPSVFLERRRVRSRCSEFAVICTLPSAGLEHSSSWRISLLLRLNSVESEGRRSLVDTGNPCINPDRSPSVFPRGVNVDVLCSVHALSVQLKLGDQRIVDSFPRLNSFRHTSD